MLNVLKIAHMNDNVGRAAHSTPPLGVLRSSGCAALVAGLLAVALVLAGCGTGSRADLIGQSAKVGALIPCAGSAEAADTMDSNSFANAVHAEGASSTVRANMKAMDQSGGIWLQPGWVIHFDDESDIGNLSYMEVSVNSSSSRLSSSCWLKSDSIQDYVAEGDLKYLNSTPVQSANKAHIASDSVVELPKLLQSYGTVDRRPQQYKWSNNDNTQETNLYAIPTQAGSEGVHVDYASMHNGVKLVSDVDIHNFVKPYSWHAIQRFYVPKDAVRLTVSAIGGNIEDVFSPVDSGTFVLMYRSPSLANAEKTMGVNDCDNDSHEHGLLILNGAEDKGDVTAVTVTDAALHYCGNLIM